MSFTKMCSRVKQRMDRLAPFMGPRLSVFTYLAKAKFNKGLEGNAVYSGMPFSFYPSDMSAIWEVLGEKEYSFLSPLLKNTKNPVLLDVGAHIGLFAYWAFGENPQSSVLSIEASPSTFRTLSGNAAKAHKGKSWNVIHAAAWKDDSKISFATSGDSMGHRVSEDNGSEEVQGMPLSRMVDMLCSQTGEDRITLLKIDIEGSEESFLSAGEASLSKIDAVVIELHPKLCNADLVRGILARNYTHVKACSDETLRKPLLYCWN